MGLDAFGRSFSGYGDPFAGCGCGGYGAFAQPRVVGLKLPGPRPRYFGADPVITVSQVQPSQAVVIGGQGGTSAASIITAIGGAVGAAAPAFWRPAGAGTYVPAVEPMPTTTSSAGPMVVVGAILGIVALGAGAVYAFGKK